MGFIKYYPYIILVFQWIGSTGKCVKAKQAAGETIDAWDYLQCAASSLSALEVNLKPLIEKEATKG